MSMNIGVTNLEKAEETDHFYINFVPILVEQ
jgi:hypothetical protein